MASLIQDCTISLVNTWKQIVETEGGLADIKIDNYLRTFSADGIFRACFGSSYSKGEEIFLKLKALQEVSSKTVPFLISGIPGMNYIPTKGNREAWALEKEIKTLILNVVKEREAASFEKDLLQIVLEGAKNSNLNQSAINRFIVDNCKNIYLAGYETTAVSATWLLMLLASHPEWQEQIRSEVIQVCNGQIPDSQIIRKMKLLTMVIDESLRLYPPVCIISREAFTDMIKLGELNIPKHVNLWSLVTLLHTDPEVWGPDSFQFNSSRFTNGITGAGKFPHLFMPFGVWPRVCLGQNLAMVELKILVSVLLSRFSFSLSPKYAHSPALHLVIEPANGVNLLFKEL